MFSWVYLEVLFCENMRATSDHHGTYQTKPYGDKRCAQICPNAHFCVWPCSDIYLYHTLCSLRFIEELQIKATIIIRPVSIISQ